MSAELFAAFGGVSHTATPQQKQQQRTAPPNPAPNPASAVPPAPANAPDPFSFFTPSPSILQLQSSQPFSQSPAPQHPKTSQPEPWFASPVGKQPQTGGEEWGNVGNHRSRNKVPAQGSSYPVWQSTVQAEDDDDGWGDFEVASSNPPTQPAEPSTATSQPRARVTRASTFDMMSNKLVDLDLDASTPEPWQQRPSWEKGDKKPQPPRPARNPDPNVLFDADFEAESITNGDDGDDEFGDFETGTPAAPTSAPDLLSLDSAPAPPKRQPPGLVLSNAVPPASPPLYPEAPRSPYGSFQERKPNPVKQLHVQPPTAIKTLEKDNEASPSPVTAWPAIESDGFGNKWEEFKDLPKTTSPVAAKLGSKPDSKPAPAQDWEWQDFRGSEDRPAPPSPTMSDDKPGPPPTNIPPPAILLSLFPQLLDLASAALLKPLLTLPPSSPAYQRVLSAPATLTFLQGYLALARVAARLIAGRKHRWHRDKFLAQGMSISATPLGQRGMKLASVDRSQSAREDGEAAEVAAVWKAHVGRLRSVVAGVNAAHAKAGHHLLRVPEVAVGLSVTTAKGVPTAPSACVVCGLKRDERVSKVDVEVEDSFGEWWVDFWGHRECKNFWTRHERELRQR